MSDKDGPAVAVAPRFTVVQEADEVDAVLGVPGDLGGQRVTHLPGADDEHALVERAPRPDGHAARPSAPAGRGPRRRPERDQHGDRRVGAEGEHQDDEQQPARRR